MLKRTTLDLLRLLSTQPCGAGASEEEILAAERQLEVEFPESFHSFLREFGWGGVGHHELIGLGKGVPLDLDLIKVTQDERSRYRPHIPPYLVPLLNDGYGNHFCLDTRHITGNDCPVVFWNHELDESQEPELEAGTYEEWLLELLREVEEQQ